MPGAKRLDRHPAQLGKLARRALIEPRGGVSVHELSIARSIVLLAHLLLAEGLAGPGVDELRGVNGGLPRLPRRLAGWGVGELHGVDGFLPLLRKRLAGPGVDELHGVDGFLLFLREGLAGPGVDELHGVDGFLLFLREGLAGPGVDELRGVKVLVRNHRRLQIVRAKGAATRA